MPSDKHKAAMDYIYDHEEEDEFIVKCKHCGRDIDPHEEPVFIVMVDQQQWCRRCAYSGKEA